MNKFRRGRLRKIYEALEDAKLELEGLRDEEQECFDNLPEGLQSSERGGEMEDAVSGMEESLGSIEDAMSALEDIINA